MQNLIRLSFVKLLLFFYVVFCLSKENRIVSLTPSITESLYILGEKENVVGITTFCRRISKKQKVVGTYLEVNVEEIVKLRPDIVFVSKEGFKKEAVDKLMMLGINVVVLDPVNSYDELKKQFLTIAKNLDKEKIAEKIIKEYERKIDKIKKSNKILGKKVLCVLSTQPIFVASEKSYIGEIIKYTGAENVIKSDIRYPQVDIEEILKLKPDVIILPSMGIQEKQAKKFFLRYKEIPAVRNNKIFVLPSNILCQPTIKNFFVAINEISKLLDE